MRGCTYSIYMVEKRYYEAQLGTIFNASKRTVQILIAES